jgi:hypothetical protein
LVVSYHGRIIIVMRRKMRPKSPKMVSMVSLSISNVIVLMPNMLSKIITLSKIESLRSIIVKNLMI